MVGLMSHGGSDQLEDDNGGTDKDEWMSSVGWINAIQTTLTWWAGITTMQRKHCSQTFAESAETPTA